MNTTILFRCPECKEYFEFDLIGEYELVSCPMCGNNFQTIKKANKLILEHFECNRQNQTQPNQGDNRYIVLEE